MKVKNKKNKQSGNVTQIHQDDTAMALTPAQQMEKIQTTMIKCGFAPTQDGQRYRKEYADVNGATTIIDAIVSKSPVTFTEPGDQAKISISGFMVVTRHLIPSIISRDVLKETLPVDCFDDVCDVLDQINVNTTHRQAPSVMAMKCELCPPNKDPTDTWMTVGNKTLCLNCSVKLQGTRG